MRVLCSGVCIVTSTYDRQRVGLTATAISSVCADPPTLLVCINRKTALGHVLQKTSRFAVNVLSPAQVGLARDFSGRLAGEKRFGTTRWVNGISQVPILPKAAAIFECRVTQLHDCNSHAVVFGQVEQAVTTQEQAFSLLYANGRYGQFDPVHN